jgi:hypothetical protein
LLYLQILLVIIFTAGLELRSLANHVTVGFERTNLSGAGAHKSQQTADADAAQRHYQAGLAALEKNDLAVAEEEMQAAARLAPKNTLIFYKLAVIQSKRDEWQAGIKSLDVAQKLGLPKELQDAANELAAKMIVKQLQAKVVEQNKKDAWLNQLSWLEGKHLFVKSLDHDSECTREQHTFHSVLNIQRDWKKGVLAGTLTLQERLYAQSTGASGCFSSSSTSTSSSTSSSSSTSAPKLESYREASLQVVVKPDDGINDGKIRLFATLESCKGNACDTLERETVYIVEKSEGGSPVISVGVLGDSGEDGRMDEEFRKEIPNRS